MISILQLAFRRGVQYYHYGAHDAQEAAEDSESMQLLVQHEMREKSTVQFPQTPLAQVRTPGSGTTHIWKLGVELKKLDISQKSFTKA
eukprot:1542752-Pyramimonas_sp.AAC.1